MPDNPKINFCPLCGTKVSPNDKVCTNCEYDLIDYQSSIIKSYTQTTASTINTPTKKGKKVIYLIHRYRYTNRNSLRKFHIQQSIARFPK